MPLLTTTLRRNATSAHTQVQRGVIVILGGASWDSPVLWSHGLPHVGFWWELMAGAANMTATAQFSFNAPYVGEVGWRTAVLPATVLVAGVPSRVNLEQATRGWRFNVVAGIPGGTLRWYMSAWA